MTDQNDVRTLSQKTGSSVYICRMEEKTLENTLGSIRPRLLFYATRLLHDASQAEDIVQDAVLSFLGSLDKGTEIRNRESFLMRTVRNACLDRIRYGSVRVTVPVEELKSSGPAVQGEKEAELSDQVALVARTVEKMPENYRSIFILRDMMGYELSEIAQMMDMKEPAVRKALSRARMQIRETLMEP